MKKLKGILVAEDFVTELERWRRLWRRHAHGDRAALRHAKDMARKRIRMFKRIREITELPRMQTSHDLGELWNEATAHEVKLVFPYRLDDRRIAAGSPGNSRKRLKRILWESIEKDSDRHIDLINAGGAPGKRLPSLADAQLGDSRAVRGLYLEAVGAAILPHLSARDVAALEAEGATVLDNEIIAVIDPVVDDHFLPHGNNVILSDESTQAAADHDEIAALFEAAGGGGLPAFETDLWHHRTIELDAARKKGLSGAGVVIGILDTGIDPSHSQFSGKTIHYRAFEANGVPRQHAAKDYHSHGTHVAAICAGRTFGVAPGADLAVAAVLTQRNDKGQMCGFLSQITAGIDWLAAHAGREANGVDIINASLGGKVSETEDYYQTINGHRVAGKLTVAAIGNDGKAGFGSHSAPGRFQCVLSVGASDANDHVTRFSAWGNAFDGDQPLADEFKPDLVAPGVNIYSALPREKGGERSGTSMACPIVTGTAALLIEQDEALRGNASDLISKLLTLTKDLPQQLHNPDKRCYGRGRLHLADI